MWKTLFLCLTVAGVLFLGSCTREEETAQPPTPPEETKKEEVAPAAEEKGKEPEAVVEEEEVETLLVWAEAEPESGAAPLTVRFKADISGGKAPRKITWNFGDGTTSSEENPVHIYEKPGKYRAQIEVSDATGDSDEDYVDIEVEEKKG